MKKITFVERDDDTSYDPVNTFFNKKKPSSVAKPPQNTSKQNSLLTTKTPIQKSIQAKKQQKTQLSQANQSLPQKIGQKGGSGYIPKKVPGFSSTSYDKIKQQTIYDLKQKQKQINFNRKTPVQKNINTSKKNILSDKKPDMIFDVPKINYDDQVQIVNDIKQSLQYKFEDETQQQQNTHNDGYKNSKFPQIKSPNSKIMQDGQTQQRIPVRKNNQTVTKNQPQVKSTVKQQFQKYTNDKQALMNKQDFVKFQIKQEPSNIKKSIQNNKQRNPTSIQKIVPNKQLTTTKIINKTQSKQDTQTNIKVNKESKELQQRIRQLESYQKQYISKIQYLQQRIEALLKTQQKYNKLFKDHKLCQQRTKDLTIMKQELSQAKQSISRLLSQSNTPYSKKRQHLLLNQITQLKKTNRQLVLRIKSYKGTDLVQMAIAKNKQQIGRQFQIDYRQEYNKLNIELESQLSSLINKVYEYLDIKSGKNKKLTKQQMTFDKQQRFLLEINILAEKLSLTFLQKYQVSPLPKCNEDCMNLYGEIQKQKQSIMKFNSSLQIISKQDINFAITQNNLQIINDIEQNKQQIHLLQQSISNMLKIQQKDKQTNRPSTSHGSSSSKTISKNLIKKIMFILQIFKKRSSISTAFHIQSICYFTYLKEFIDGKLNKLSEELVNLYGRLKQMKDIFDLGGNTAKQSLYLYLEVNLQSFCLILPNLDCKIKQIKSSYQQISKGIHRKMKIKQI